MMENSNIIKALVKVQSEITNPVNSCVNPFYKSKYAPLNQILDLVRPLLSKNDIFLVQETGTLPDEEGGDLFIQTRLYHTSGECLSSPRLLLKPDKNTVQGMGGAITYGRRYQLTTMLGIAGEDDNDGNDTISNNTRTRPKNVQHIHKKPAPRCPTIPYEVDIVNEILNKELQK